MAAKSIKSAELYYITIQLLIIKRDYIKHTVCWCKSIFVYMLSSLAYINVNDKASYKQVVSIKWKSFGKLGIFWQVNWARRAK